jgi:hypothetical protein
MKIPRPRIPPYPRALEHAKITHPSYDIEWYLREPGEVRYIAAANRPGIHPVVVITGSLAELDTSLDPCDKAAPVSDLFEPLADRRMST